MHKNQPLPDQNVVKNENKFKSKLIEKPCSEYCYSLQQQNNQSSVTQIAEIAKSYKSDWALYNKSFSPKLQIFSFDDANLKKLQFI